MAVIPLARFVLWIAVAAWVLLAAAFLARLASHAAFSPRPGQPRCQRGSRQR